VPPGWAVSPAALPGGAEPGQGISMSFQVRPAETARYSQPYWTREAGADRVALVVPEDESLPWSPPDVVARLRYTSNGVPATLERPAVWRYEGRAGGEKRKVVNVVPALSLRVTPA